MKLKQLASAVILATTGLTATAATYELTPAPVQEYSFYNFAQSIDNTGTMVVINESEYSPPIDLSLLDFENENFAALFDDPEAASQGNFSNADYQAIYSYIETNRSSGSVLVQEIASYRSYKTDTVNADLIAGMDVFNEDFDDYSRSASTQIVDSVDGAYFVGSGNTAFSKINYTNEDGDDFVYVLNDTFTQGIVEANGQSTLLPPPAGGDGFNAFSDASAINSALQVAGWGSTEFTEEFQTLIDNCNDPEERGDQPLELCLFRLGGDLATRSYRRALIWQLDAQGNVLSTTAYPLVFTPEEDDDSVAYTTVANGINDNGVAVGRSHTGETVIYARPNSNRRLYAEVTATAFADGETSAILPVDEDNLSSEALDINNDGWVLGTVLRENNGYARNQMFVHNIDSGESLFPAGFFQTAGVTPRAINNNGIVVGEGEYESDVQTNRQLRAFMYDINVGEFIDLNTLLSCEQRQVYTLVSANDINDNNEIIANARLISTRRYITGEEVLNDAGDTFEMDRIVAVKLTPTGNDTIDQCEVVEEENYERSGASSSWYGLAVLGLLAFFRRRVKK